MIAEKHLALRALLESSDGIHLTTYLTHRGGIQELKSQIRETLHVAQLHLQPVMNRVERQKFLMPLHSLLNNRPLLHGLRGNFGLFRNQDSFRLLRIPVKVEPLCVIATSFHVKPLLRWMQTDREFLLLNIEAKGAQLYHGSQFTLRCMENIDFAKVFRQERATSDSRRQYLHWLREWILAYQNSSSLRLFLTGEKTMAEDLHKHIRYNNTAKPALLMPLQDRCLNDICLQIRTLLKVDARHYLEQAFLEFESAEVQNLAKRSLVQIAKATAQGRVRKLIIAEETQIFGKFNPKTGSISLHAGHLDHEDDDILDDLAQAVLAQGGEVVVAPREQIPRASPALAILYDHYKDGASGLVSRGYEFSADKLRVYG